MSKILPPKPRVKKLHPLLLLRPLLTEEEHLSIINPPHTAHLLMMEGTANRKSLWDVWYRIRVGLCCVERVYPLSVPEVRSVVEEFERFFLDQPPAKDSDFKLSPELLTKLGDVLDVTDQVQRETNRAYLLEDSLWARDYCLYTLDQMERRYAKHLKHELKVLENKQALVAQAA